VPQTINGAATYSCSFSATVSGNAGESETDTVTATVSDDEDNVAAESDSATVTIDDVTPTISLTVTSSAGPIYPGDAVDFTYRVDNLSAEPVTLTGLDDSVFGDLSSECSLPAGIAGNGYFDCVINRTLNADHISTATATAEDDEANEGTATAQASANVIAPAIQVEIQPDVSIAYAGQTIIYRYTVENTGEVDLHSVSATDDRLGAITLDKSSLVPGEVASGTATDVVDAGDVPGEYVNNVTAAGTSPSETVVTDIDTATVRLVHAIFLPLVRASAGTAAQSVEPVSIAYSEGKAPMPDLIAMILSTFTAGFAGKAPH
jgi:hypothetical protein